MVEKKGILYEEKKGMWKKNKAHMGNAGRRIEVVICISGDICDYFDFIVSPFM